MTFDSQTRRRKVRQVAQERWIIGNPWCKRPDPLLEDLKPGWQIGCELKDEITTSLFGQEQSPCTSESLNSDTSLPEKTKLKAREMLANLAWYQFAMDQYQRTFADWQVWGEAKNQEINEMRNTIQELRALEATQKVKEKEKERQLKAELASSQENLDQSLLEIVKRDSRLVNQQNNIMKMKEVARCCTNIRHVFDTDSEDSDW